MGKEKYTINFIREKKLILLEGISGSRMYGCHIEGESDFDYRGIYICLLDDFLCRDYPNQIEDEGNDIVYYEIGRYFELLMKNNPNILELLSIPEDCVVEKHPLMDLIDPKDYVSKLCKETLGGYANQQIKKAKGLNKKINQPMAKEKKTPLDFCCVIENGESYPLKDILEENEMEQKFCGLVSIPNAKDVYGLYYDWVAHHCFSFYIEEKRRERHKKFREEYNLSKGLGYKGILKDGDEENSNDLRLSSIPKSQMDECEFIIYYNKDGYTQYCKQYKEYWDWVKKRNEDRYQTNLQHGGGYDSKNMMHCYRLCEMGVEIAKGEGIKVRRPNRDFLMKIRKGEMDYEKILRLSEELLQKSDHLFEQSNLPNKPDLKKAKETEIEIRKKFYNLL